MLPVGWLPALNALNLPLPTALRIDFRHDAARGIAGTEKQHIERLFGPWQTRLPYAQQAPDLSGWEASGDVEPQHAGSPRAPCRRKLELYRACGRSPTRSPCGSVIQYLSERRIAARRVWLVERGNLRAAAFARAVVAQLFVRTQPARRDDRRRVSRPRLRNGEIDRAGHPAIHFA